MDIEKLRKLYDATTQGEWVNCYAPKGNGADVWIESTPKPVSDPDNILSITDALNYSYYASSRERMAYLADEKFDRAEANHEFIAYVHNSMPEILELLDFVARNK